MRSIVVLFAVFAGLCSCRDAPPPPPSHAPEVPAAPAEPEPGEEPEPTKVEKEENPLPPMQPFDRDSLEDGMRRLADCKEYDNYVKEALIWHHERKHFPARFGTPIEPLVKNRLSSVPSKWASDGRWGYFELGDNLYLLDAQKNTVHGGYSEMYAYPAIHALGAGGLLFFGRSSNLGGAKQIRFERGKSSGWYRDRNGQKYPRYIAYRSTSFWLYGREGDRLDFKRILGGNGELVGIHFDTENDAAYVMLLTEPHIDPDAMESAIDKAKSAENVQDLRAILSTIRTSGPPEARPRYGWQVNPRGGRTKGKTSYTKCSNIWIANDHASLGEKLLAVHRFDVKALKYTGSMAIAVDDPLVAAAGNRLYVARRLRGVKRDDVTEEPASELDVFELGEKPRLLSHSVVDGVPVELAAAGVGGILTTTRWGPAETLAYGVLGAELPDEPSIHPPGLRLGKVLGEAPEGVWSAGLPLQYEVVVPLGDQIIGGVLEKRRLRFDLFDATGAKVATSMTPKEWAVLKWSPARLVSSGDSFILPVKLLTESGEERSSLLAQWTGDVLSLSSSRGSDGKDPVALTDERFVSVGGGGAAWISRESDEVVKEVRWKDIKVDNAGVPNGPAR